MKRLVMLVLISCSLIAMQRTKLRRTYSTNPLVDDLKRALMMNDSEVLDERLVMGLPWTIDRQYVLLGLAKKGAVRRRLLTAIEGYWYNFIPECPELNVSSLLFGLNTLNTSYNLRNLDYAFKMMLTRLKRRLFACPTISQSKEHTQQVQQIPAYEEPPQLQSFAAHIVATNGFEVPGIYKEVLESIKPRIYVNPPFVESAYVHAQNEDEY